MFKKIMGPVLITAMLAGCVHTTPMPVPLSQTGDDVLSCKTITTQMQDMTKVAKDADKAGNAQVATNLISGITGVFIIFPWFLIDTSDAHAVDAKAANQRYDHLRDMADAKNCSADTDVLRTEPGTQAVAVTK
jgi:hypothetical protein